jgi:hypothetical protein
VRACAAGTRAAFAPAFAAEAAFAVAAEAAGGVELVGAVDPHHAGLQARGHIQREADRLAPDAGRQAVARVVGQVHRLVRRAEGLHRQHRAEDLVLHDLAGGVHAGHQRGREVAALVGSAPALAWCTVAPAARARSTKPATRASCPVSDQRAHVGGLVQRAADADLGHARLQLGQQRVGRALLHQQPAAGAADLALVEPDAVDQAFDRGVQVGVGEHDEG